MINLRSLVLVETELAKLGLQPLDIVIGSAETLQDLTAQQQLQLRIALRQSGLELLENKIDILVHRVKYIIMDVVYSDKPLQQNLSGILSETLGYDYTYLSNQFSIIAGTTIEKYYICHKIERVKRLLLYEGLSLTQIAEKMRYSSPSHLSSQFKKITGTTSSHFKDQNRDKRPLLADCG